MANNTTKKNVQRPAHSGFEAEPPAGTGMVYPKGTTFKRNPNGTVTPVYPKKSTSKKK